MHSCFELTHVVQEKYMWGFKRENVSPDHSPHGKLCFWKVTEGSGALKELNPGELIILRKKLKAEHLALVDSKREELKNSPLLMTVEEQSMNLVKASERTKEVFLKHVDSFNWVSVRFAYRVIADELHLSDSGESLILPDDLEAASQSSTSFSESSHSQDSTNS